MRREVSVPLPDPLGWGKGGTPPSLGYCTSDGGGRIRGGITALSCHSCTVVVEAHEASLGQRWFGCRGWGWDLPTAREWEHILVLFSCLCLLASCMTGHPGRGLEITPCVLCGDHPLPSTSPKGVSPSRKSHGLSSCQGFCSISLATGAKKKSV